MSPHSAFMQLITKAAIGFGALFLVGVVLAAIPNHRPPVVPEASGDPGAMAEQAEEQGQAMDHSKMLAKSLSWARIENKDPLLVIQSPNRSSLTDSIKQLFVFGQSILPATELSIEFPPATTRQSCLTKISP